jgi:hypothetical protein
LTTIIDLYDRKRRHSALNYQTIQEFNKQINMYKNVASLMRHFLLAHPVCLLIHLMYNQKGQKRKLQVSKKANKMQVQRFKP